MKRTLAILLAFALIFALAACGQTETPAPETEAAPAATAELTPEPTPAPRVETWYGERRGVELTLALSSDGSYTLTLGKEAKSGTWSMKDGGIVLDGDEAAPLYRVDGKLMWQGLGLSLSAERSGVSAYAPAELLSEGVTAAAFGGYWKSAYVDVKGVILPAARLGDKTDLFVDAADAASATVKAALGGPLFGDAVVNMRFEDGALRCAADAVSVELRIQADGLLRMTLSAPDGDMVLYLAPDYVEGLSPESTT